MRSNTWAVVDPEQDSVEVVAAEGPVERQRDWMGDEVGAQRSQSREDILPGITEFGSACGEPWREMVFDHLLLPQDSFGVAIG
ncbi:hypothetical protein AB0M45_25290 [Nocardia sp. NPDC051787]|uniref:hypothetical protein n=1 Tax=Nocardia sp. NPDC051787 TaxID=3155415 RepID=UPI0034267014